MNDLGQSIKNQYNLGVFDLKKGFPDAEIEKEMSKVYECSELFLNYGADIKGSDTTIFGATEGLGDVSLI